MAPSEESPDRTEVIAAAYAAASWARARRAAWTDAPLPETPVAKGTPPEAAQTAPHPRDAPSHEGLRRKAPEPLRDYDGAHEPASAAVDHFMVPLAATPARPRADVTVNTAAPTIFSPVETASSRSRTFLAVGVAIAVVAGGLLLASRQWSSRATPQVPAAAPSQAPPARAADPRPRPAVESRRTGTLAVTSTPGGAEVSIDGKRRGVTPVTVPDLAPGRHTVSIQSAEGAVQRTVTIAAGETATVDESIFAGFVALDAPFEVTVSEDGRPLRVDDRNQILLRPGAHELRIANAALAFDTTRPVDVQPGQVTTIYVTPPKSTLTVTASATAEIWIDGTRAGETPLFSFAVDIGTHDILVRRNGSERRMTVTVTTRPLTIDADAQR